MGVSCFVGVLRVAPRVGGGRGSRCDLVGAVDALVGGGPPALVDCVGDLFDDLAEGCFLVGVVVFVVEVGEVCPDLLFGGGDVCVYVGEYIRGVRYDFCESV